MQLPFLRVGYVSAMSFPDFSRLAFVVGCAMFAGADGAQVRNQTSARRWFQLDVISVSVANNQF